MLLRALGVLLALPPLLLLLALPTLLAPRRVLWLPLALTRPAPLPLPVLLLLLAVTTDWPSAERRALLARALRTLLAAEPAADTRMAPLRPERRLLWWLPRPPATSRGR